MSNINDQLSSKRNGGISEEPSEEPSVSKGSVNDQHTPSATTELWVSSTYGDLNSTPEPYPVQIPTGPVETIPSGPIVPNPQVQRATTRNRAGVARRRKAVRKYKCSYCSA